MEDPRPTVSKLADGAKKLGQAHKGQPQATSDLTHWKLLTNPDYIGAYVLEAAQVDELVVQITEVKREIVKGVEGREDECTVAHLKGQKPFILNKTNCKTIQTIYGTPFIEEWAGKQLTLYVANVKAYGDVIPALRIRPKVPVVTKPVLTPEHARWKGAVEGLKAGSCTLQDIERNYTVSDINRQKLIDEAI